MVKSPVLKEYLRDQPCCPKRRRPSTTEWNQQSAKRHALKSSVFVQPSIRSWLKLSQPRAMLDLMSAGASFDTLTAPCISDSGMFFMLPNGGGSADRKQRKSGCASSCTTSSTRSSCGTQDCIRWQFCNITHPPFLANDATTASAGFSCPCPMEIFLKLPASKLMPNCLPSPSTHGVGSTPGNSTKNVGVWLVVSAYVAAMSKGFCSTNSRPITSAIQSLRAVVTRSGLKDRSRIKRSKGERDFWYSPGNLATSGFSESNHLSQSSESDCMLSPKPANFFSPSKALTLGHEDSCIHSWRGPMLPGSWLILPLTK
mmetsp:Transcript_10342/g.17039  ORF Transcript_10342/g.17039 Transcript_10342/m.17039 type:complete len:314 (+) Transcript_10342:1392-2333(+)